jgi:hypothetical protein
MPGYQDPRASKYSRHGFFSDEAEYLWFGFLASSLT